MILLVCFFTVSIVAQKKNSNPDAPKTSAVAARASDPLLEHLRAAENHQLAGDLINAAIENRAVLSIALQRYGNAATEEGKYDEAIRVINQGLELENSAANRTNLAAVYLRQNLIDKALNEARDAVALDPKHIGAHYILGNIYYTKEDYKSALPELEFVFENAPDFEIARALGLTYLNLKKIDAARNHFEKMRVTAGKPNADLHILFAKLYEVTDYPGDTEKELVKALAIEPKKPRLNFYLGFLLLENGGSERLGEAGAAFERELSLTPNDFTSTFFSGVVASAENNHVKAIDYLKRATQMNPNSGEAYLFLGQSQIETNDLAEAEKNLRRAVELEGNGGKNTQARRTHFMLGRLLLRLGKKEEGEKELKIAGQLQQASLDNSRNEINRILGQVAESTGAKDSDEQSNDATGEIKLSSEKAEQLQKIKSYLGDIIAQSYNNLGVIATQNSQLGEAIKFFSEAFQWKPDLPNLNRNLGIVSFRAERFDQAIAPLARQIKANPQDVLIRKMLGSSYYLTKDYKGAVETLKPIEAQLTEDAELTYFYGLSLIQSKLNKESTLVFDRLAKISNQNPESLFYAAQGFMILGEYDRAIKEFRQILVLSPDTAKANYFIGQSFIRMNRFADAEKAFSREIEINPADAVSKYHLALTLIERKIETDKAVSLLEDAINLRPDYADALYQLGKIYLEKGETGKAIEKLESAAAADASKDYVHYQLSIAYRKMARREDAERALKTYQKLKSEERKTDAPMPMGGKENSSPKLNKK